VSNRPPPPPPPPKGNRAASSGSGHPAATAGTSAGASAGASASASANASANASAGASAGASVSVSAKGSDELQRWIASLEAENVSAGRRGKLLIVVFLFGLALLLALLGWLYQTTVRSYAVLDGVEIAQNPASQGRVEIAFDVRRPGRVFLARRSGGITTEVMDYFEQPGRQTRSWSWLFEPGEPIDVRVRYRGWLWRREQSRSFPTSSKADIVILIDTTGSMNRSIATLRDRCVQFSEAMRQQRIQHRFALVGFGDAAEPEWRDVRAFTDDVAVFRSGVEGLRRFDGGDLPESALDALLAALELPFDEQAMRRFFLVTDARFHAPAKSGESAAVVAQRLAERRVLLQVFTQPEIRGEYQPLVGSAGRVQTIADFGQVLSEGRILED
jgi:hypothetical protein